jgi:hypothetical protein
MHTPLDRGCHGKRRTNEKRRSILRDRVAIMAVCALTSIMVSTGAPALEPLSRYADQNGVINVEELTCAQLSNTYQDDADFLAAWFSGWYSDLSRKHMGHITRARVGEYELTMYCRAHPDLRIVDAVTALLNDDQ